MSDPLLRDYERKRGRAVHHLHVLRKAVEGFTNVDRQPVPGEFDADASQYLFDVPLERIDRDWALLVGDYIYNARASIDYLITALIRSTGEEEHHKSQFPIYVAGRKPNASWLEVEQRWDKDTRTRIKGNLDGTPSGTEAALKPLQPFDGVPYTTNPVGHPLFVLNTLSNRDKHRGLNLLLNRASINFVDERGQPIFDGPAPDVRISEPDEGDTYAVRLTVREKRDVDVYLLPVYDIRLHESPVFGEVVETLAGIDQFIDRGVLPVVRSLL
ncbi:MAG: hypothetical protein QOD13_1176 [Thermoleophilaceae bacterium]|jgi:hypothetical protein|nr:hypothetical protein [Thermoleophilaceae bacterium]